MLTCVYHPIDGMKVVDAGKADELKNTGFWFDSPLKAKEYRSKVEKGLKTKKPKDIKTGENDER